MWVGYLTWQIRLSRSTKAGVRKYLPYPTQLGNLAGNLPATPAHQEYVPSADEAVLPYKLPAHCTYKVGFSHLASFTPPPTLPAFCSPFGFSLLLPFGTGRVQAARPSRRPANDRGCGEPVLREYRPLRRPPSTRCAQPVPGGRGQTTG